MSYTVSREDFSKIHNAKVNIVNINERLERVVHPDIMQQLNNAVESLIDGLKNIYVQENRDYEKRTQLYNAVSNKNGFNSVWSIHTVNDFTGVPFPDARRVAYTNHWGENPIVVDGDGMLNWEKLWGMADRAISQSGDTHHIFIEEFTLSKDDPTTLFLSTGS
jgi:hypothetical protein